MKLIWVDVGGTSTDLVYGDMATGMVAIQKVSTTPAYPSQGLMTGVLELCRAQGIDPSDIAYVLHGTTTATNADWSTRARAPA